MKMQFDKRFFYIAINSFREIIREPVFLILTMCMVYLCGLMPFFVSFAFGEHTRLIRDGAFAYHLMLGLAAGSVAAAAAVFREMRQGTASVVLAKPVSRDMFFIAKFCGVVGAMLVFSFIAWIATLLSVRMGVTPFETDWRVGVPFFAGPLVASGGAAVLNCKFGKPFASYAFFILAGILAIVLVWSALIDVSGGFVAFGSLLDFRITSQSLLITMAIMILSSIAISLSVRLRPEFTLPVCLVFLFAGLLSDYCFGRFVERSVAARVVYYILPNWQHYWVVDALVNDGGIPLRYLAAGLIYALLYIIAVLCVGMVVFRKSQVDR